MSDSATQADEKGWWIASNGQWYPPEQHPLAGTPTPVPTQAAAFQAPGNPATAPATDTRAQFSDLFETALQASHLGDAVTVQHHGEPVGPERDGGTDMALADSFFGGPSGHRELEAASPGPHSKRRWLRAH
ncbi:MAG: hypothetical protein ACYCVN_13915 [Acidimicrobiales bacterium]